MSNPKSNPIVRLSGVRLRYGKTHALDGIDLEIPTGRMVGLIGPDGVGKSSLLALVSGARTIQEGTVEVLCRDMSKHSRRHGEGEVPECPWW